MAWTQHPIFIFLDGNKLNGAKNWSVKDWNHLFGLTLFQVEIDTIMLYVLIVKIKLILYTLVIYRSKARS